MAKKESKREASRTPRRALVGALIACALWAASPAAHAQGALGHTTASTKRPGSGVPAVQLVRGLPSVKEQAYGLGLAKRLRVGARSVARIVHPVGPGRGDLGRGVRVRLDDGTTVDRLLFADEHQAYAYALHGAEAPADEGAGLLVEARGRQVVVVRGAIDGSYARTGRLLDAAWDGLPVPHVLPSVSYANSGKGGLAFVARGGDPELEEQFAETLRHLGRQRDEGTTGVRALEDEQGYAFAYPSGMAGRAVRTANGLVVVTAPSSPELEHLEGFVGRALGKELLVTAPIGRGPTDPFATRVQVRDPGRDSSGLAGAIRGAEDDRGTGYGPPRRPLRTPPSARRSGGASQVETTGRAYEGAANRLGQLFGQ